MRAKNVTISQLEQALNETNGKYDNNLMFNRLEQKGKGVLFTPPVN